MSRRHYVFVLMAFMMVCSARASAQSALPDAVRLAEVTDQSGIERITTEFRRDLKSVGSKATITRCTHVVDFVQDMPSGHDSSFGAICAVNDGGMEKHWLMCDDWMIGKFTATDGFIPTTEGVGEFIYVHCPPGG
jgi:hypothetical protein